MSQFVHVPASGAAHRYVSTSSFEERLLVGGSYLGGVSLD
jgi:hypothetical protein